MQSIRAAVKAEPDLVLLWERLRLLSPVPVLVIEAHTITVKEIEAIDHSPASSRTCCDPLVPARGEHDCGGRRSRVLFPLEDEAVSLRAAWKAPQSGRLHEMPCAKPMRNDPEQAGLLSLLHPPPVVDGMFPPGLPGTPIRSIFFEGRLTSRHRRDRTLGQNHGGAHRGFDD